jgi:two-component system response regulator HydG
MPARLTIETGQGEPRSCPLELGAALTLGRHRKNTVVLHDEHASRWHAEIFHDKGRWFIRDTGTMNGTRVNGTAITQPFPLEDGQLIGIGRTFLRFALEAELNGAKTAPQLQVAPPAEATTDLFDPEKTVLCQDELTMLCRFMSSALKEGDAQALIHKALEVVHGQVGAAVSGFLNLDREQPLPKMVLPKLARVDVHLSRQLTQAVQRQGRTVWLGAQSTVLEESESLLSYADALCVPLLAGETSLGALHVYRAGRLFTEREVRFCEVLAGHAAIVLNVLRARRNLEAENSRLRSHSPLADEIIGQSPVMQALRQKIDRLAPHKTTVLIVGESGSGKELVALALHRHSPRREGPLVSVNCAAIAPSLLESELFGHRRGAFSSAERDHAGLFQQADEGTLFLDEVGELSHDCQAKLLRVMEGKGFRPVGAEAETQVDVRILAATHRNLQQEVDASRFRQDLFFRLQGIQIAVPALREHVDDIPDLVEYFVERLSVEYGRQIKLTAAALKRLQEYAWPGNVRQFRSVLEGAVALGDKNTIDAADLMLPTNSSSTEPPSLNLETLEMWAIRKAIRQTRGNLTQAAHCLGVVRDTLANKMKKYGITREE